MLQQQLRKIKKADLVILKFKKNPTHFKVNGKLSNEELETLKYLGNVEINLDEGLVKINTIEFRTKEKDIAIELLTVLRKNGINPNLVTFSDSRRKKRGRRDNMIK